MDTRWLGVPAQKCPLDLWVYQEILCQLKPELIIECGTAKGGSSLFLASICDFLGNGKVLSIDIDGSAKKPGHERINYLVGSSTSREIVEEAEKAAEGKSPVMVILDSDHKKDHVLKEMEIYSRFVTPSSYLIVEDTNLNGNPLNADLYPEYSPGPMEAVNEFLASNEGFTADRSKEKYYLTFNPKGYLKRIL